MWNKRYAEEAYAYGIEPNTFYKEQLFLLKPGKALFPAEGEGRNAVFAAKNGWDVTAFDSSSEARKKAEKLALANNVEIAYHINSFEDIELEENSFDLIVLIFAHMQNRHNNHIKLLKFLKPGGTLLIDGFSKNQINNTTGGPRSIELLFSEEELRADFNGLSRVKIWEEVVILNEGEYHKGKTSVIRLIGTKFSTNY